MNPDIIPDIQEGQENVYIHNLPAYARSPTPTSTPSAAVIPDYDERFQTIWNGMPGDSLGGDHRGNQDDDGWAMNPDIIPDIQEGIEKNTSQILKLSAWVLRLQHLVQEDAMKKKLFRILSLVGIIVIMGMIAFGFISLEKKIDALHSLDKACQHAP